MELHMKHFSELTAAELYELLQVREAVFVVEQNCPYRDADGLDTEAYHLWLSDGDGIAAYLRLLPPGARFPEASIGRVLSLRRRQGLATRLLTAALAAAQEKYGARAVRIEAQVYARSLYEKLGFVQVSGEFPEDGIPHIRMLWEAK